MVLEGAKCLEMDLDYKCKGRLKSTEVFIVYIRGGGWAGGRDFGWGRYGGTLCVPVYPQKFYSGNTGMGDVGNPSDQSFSSLYLQQ